MSWKRVCTAGDVSESTLKEFEIDGVTIVVANLGDEVRAFPPMCPHMEEPLAESGLCRAGVLTCTKHLWQWNMRTGKEMGMAEKPLIMYPAKCENGDISVFIEKELTYDYDEDEDEE